MVQTTAPNHQLDPVGAVQDPSAEEHNIVRCNLFSNNPKSQLNHFLITSRTSAEVACMQCMHLKPKAPKAPKRLPERQSFFFIFVEAFDSINRNDLRAEIVIRKRVIVKDLASRTDQTKSCYFRWVMKLVRFVSILPVSTFMFMQATQTTCQRCW